MPSHQAGPMFARFLFSDLTAWANRQVRVNDSNVSMWYTVFHPEISSFLHPPWKVVSAPLNHQGYPAGETPDVRARLIF